LSTIVIEGSKENEKQGEYVIDVCEYYEDSNDTTEIKYFQLKHTTVQKDTPFILSDLKDTVEGFAKRYSQHLKESNSPSFSFTIVTNRPIDESFKTNISLLASGNSATGKFGKTIKSYTGFTDDELQEFCKLLHFNDSEGDYNSQKNDLRSEIAQLISGAVDNAQMASIVNLVQEKVLPDSDHEICRQDVLKRFDVSYERDLFPAPAIWELAENIIERKQHYELIDTISVSPYPVIVHAPGGVGKSVFCRQLLNTLPSDSLGIAYDCFGAGRYRSRSEPRHRHRDALVQIINELAVQGLCKPLLVQDTSQDSDIMKKFLSRITNVVATLRQINSSAKLFILIDAADNAEMAAKEYNHPCFANELLREHMPDGCIFVFLCRTERIQLLKPSSKIVKLELKTFSESETMINLRKWFSNADENDGLEFHRLTSGNPRVQANALNTDASSVLEVLRRLGPAGMTVDEQIEHQLKTAVFKIKDSLSESYQEQIQAICLGLSSLPPHIPVDILAKAAAVSIETIKSFVADIGRSLWLSDESVQFRDEPTETWFRKTFLAKIENFQKYINILEPLAVESIYVAEVLPHLYLQGKKYEELIEMALSDTYLPEGSPIDARNVRVYRLQFAFRAALKANRFDDAIKIAMRAGEEVAGNERQIALFRKNIDLLVTLQDKQKIQDIAFKRVLSSAWNGSENVYTASLLSGIKEYKGEARGYLRAAVNWLQIYFEDLRNSDEQYPENKVTQEDILELAYAFFNVHGAEECVNFLNRFNSKEFSFGVIRKLTIRLIDIGSYGSITDLLGICVRQPYYIVAIVSELLKIGRFPEEQYIETCLSLMTSSRTRIRKSENHYHGDDITPAIISFVEVCLFRRQSSKQLLRVLKFYIPEKASRMVYNGHQSHERTVYLRALAIKTLLQDKLEPEIDAILPKNLLKGKVDKSNDLNNEIKEFKEVINGLFPWYYLKAKILDQQDFDFKEEVNRADNNSRKARSNRYRSYDSLSNEIAALQSSILITYRKGAEEEIIWFYETYLRSNNALWIPDELNMVRASFRTPYLNLIKQQTESLAYQRIKNITEDSPEEISERYIGLARAVLNSAVDDAGVYFEEGVNIASKFGDEIVRRWEAVVNLAKQACTGDSISDKLAYRFIRCAEVVGEYVDREKYWNRSEAIAICTEMSAGQGIAALSRWRDRNIGRFEYQFEALLVELVRSGKISSKLGWVMCRFFSSHENSEVLSLCLESETDMEMKKKLFSDAVHLLRLEGTTIENWEKFKKIANTANIENHMLNEVLDCDLKNNALEKEKENPVSEHKGQPIENILWDDIFGSFNILIGEEFEKCLLAFNNRSQQHYYKSIKSFWDEVIRRLREKEIWNFIDVLLDAELSSHEVSLFFDSLPNEWKNKISFKRNRPTVLKKLGNKYAQKLVSAYSYKYFLLEFNVLPTEIDELKKGIFEGLASGFEFSDAEMFFGFVSLAAPLVAPLVAQNVLEFTLSRFELHIDENFGDGEWAEWLHTSENVDKNIAGFIWSALASPRSVERWNAAHAVRALGTYGCKEVIDELINWMQHNKVDAFGHVKYPFYNLHGRLYLLIALERVSSDRPELIASRRDIFVHYALNEHHILIQWFSAKIAINLQDSSKERYDKQTTYNLESVGKSRMPIIEIQFDETIDSYWHTNNLVDTEHGFHFGWDFDNYWYKPLGSVFGIQGDQVEDIAAHVIIKEWGIKEKNGYSNDARSSLWNRQSSYSETEHSHGDYPRTDNLDFYISYHAMMVTASKLLEKMQIASKRDWYENEWNEWLSQHLLTCEDGKWLIDYRDPLPITRPKWIYLKDTDNWRTDITENIFQDAILSDDNDELWLTVKGGWSENSIDRKESFTISSALVSRSTSDALMRALETCSDSHDYKLPSYQENDMEIESFPFRLKGWVEDDSVSKALDEYDSYGNNVDYPPYKIGSSVITKLGLELKDDGKTWFLPTIKNPALKCNIWTGLRSERDESPDQSGKILKASLPFLKQMCLTLDCNIIIEVTVERNIKYKYRNSKEKYEYLNPVQKLFIITSDGELRTTAENYKLG